MRIQAYIRVVSDEATILAIQRETNLPDAAIKPLKAPLGEAGDVWWNWQTEPVPLDVDNADDGIRALLSGHRSIFPIIRRYQGPGTDIYLEVVNEYQEDDEPWGLYLSAEAIQLLAELGGALDNDAVPLVDESPS